MSNPSSYKLTARQNKKEKSSISWWNQLMTVKPDEWRPLLWSFSYFFSLLCGYCIIRPMRDEMGIADGRQKGIEQMEQSKQRMGIGVIDLMQIHNLRDWKTHPCKIA